MLSFFLDAGKKIVDALVETGGEDVLRRHDVELFDTGQPGEHVEVCRPQATWVGGLVRNTDDDPPIGARPIVLQQPPAQRVLIQTAARLYERLELAEGGH